MQILKNIKDRFCKKQNSSNIPVIGRDIAYVSEERKLNVLKALVNDTTVDNFESRKDIFKSLVN